MRQDDQRRGEPDVPAGTVHGRGDPLSRSSRSPGGTLHSITGNMPPAMIVADGHGVIVAISNAAASLFDCAAEETIGRSIGDYLPEAREAIPACTGSCDPPAVVRAVAGGGRRTLELRVDVAIEEDERRLVVPLHDVAAQQVPEARSAAEILAHAAAQAGRSCAVVQRMFAPAVPEARGSSGGDADLRTIVGEAAAPAPVDCDRHGIAATVAIAGPCSMPGSDRDLVRRSVATPVHRAADAAVGAGVALS